jgi:hypothetical protein
MERFLEDGWNSTYPERIRFERIEEMRGRDYKVYSRISA